LRKHQEEPLKKGWIIKWEVILFHSPSGAEAGKVGGGEPRIM